MGEVNGASAGISAIAALDEPTRRRLYEFVVRQPAPVSRDQAADAVQAPRNTVSFHLDKLVAEGLLEAVYQRRTGRTGPGAGRPSKLYRRSPGQIAVSLPDRRYESAAHLLADALQEAQDTGEPPRAVLDRRARELGRGLGRDARPATPAPDARTGVMQALEALGFEPRAAGDTIALVNCPFHSLARQHTELVCGMNLCLLTGLLEGLAATGVTARLEPDPEHCCVRLHPAGPTPAAH
ncbi:helix-turn-helix transcriptional regulator [Nonomuraea gerenzanensis]|uniref:Possible transcriptional regulator n=1 Tax=Nonomuraea gerenzanensis TaxID=93944 RepID=A0A1M4EDG1_9ACTN|nr:helix-turn-helix domain-containing protein [Nonomuraea gerenzanensis]UBU08565.1 helix-turn-helix domain-containing protein [Nonomuraea gerenzanensis]SBO96919.1 possible transcriptional regulator [Nonomuraea gerenzanensis]